MSREVLLLGLIIQNGKKNLSTTFENYSLSIVSHDLCGCTNNESLQLQKAGLSCDSSGPTVFVELQDCHWKLLQRRQMMNNEQF